MAAACGPSAPQKRYSMPKPRQTGRPARAALSTIKPGRFSPFGRQSGQVALLGLRQPAQLCLSQVHLPQHLHRCVRRIMRRVGARGARRGRASRSAGGRLRRALGALIAEAQNLHRDDRRLRLARRCASGSPRSRPRPPPRRRRRAGRTGAEVLTAAVTGTPLLLPWAWMLAALTTCSAATLTLPELRTPASPGSIVPSGAIRSTSPRGTSGIGFSVAMPAPAAGVCGAITTLPKAS